MSNALQSAILAALDQVKASSQHPLRVDALPALVGADLDACGFAVDTLHLERAASIVVITRGGETYRVCWPTGVPPQPVGSRAFTIGGHTQADAAAKAIRPRAATPSVNPPQPPFEKGGSKTQEPTMPRIAKPAAPAAQMPETPPRKRPGNGALRDEILATLMDATGAEPFSVDRIHDLCPSSAGYDSTASTLRALEKRGLVVCESRVIEGQRRNVYWLKPEDSTAAKPIPAAAARYEPGPSGEHIPRRDLAVLEAKAGSVRLERASFSYHDDGSLDISDGDAAVSLAAPQLARLVAFLGRIAP